MAPCSPHFTGIKVPEIPKAQWESRATLCATDENLMAIRPNTAPPNAQDELLESRKTQRPAYKSFLNPGFSIKL
jgi:hypothetical protein